MQRVMEDKPTQLKDQIKDLGDETDRWFIHTIAVSDVVHRHKPNDDTERRSIHIADDMTDHRITVKTHDVSELGCYFQWKLLNIQ